MSIVRAGLCLHRPVSSSRFLAQPAAVNSLRASRPPCLRQGQALPLAAAQALGWASRRDGRRAVFDGRSACPIVIRQATELLAMATVTRAELAKAVSEETGLPHREARVLVDMAIEAMAARLAAGEEVKLSSFGSFRLRDKAARTGRNPKTREAAAISPRRVVTFRASHVLKARIYKEMSKRADGS